MNGQQQGYPEELQIVVDKMKANKEPQFNIDIMVRSYYASKQDASSGPEPTPSTPAADQQEVEKTEKSKPTDPVKDTPSASVNQEAISNAIDKYATGFWAEEKLTPKLAEVLPEGWSVEEGISEGAQGGKQMSVNII